MKRLVPVGVWLIVAIISASLFGQQSDDAQATPTPENVDLVTQVQQLRAEVERLSEQIDRLNNEVKSMQGIPKPLPPRIRAKAAPAATSTPAPVPAPPAASPTVDTVTITTLVFRDGHHVETRNYAIVGESVWVYSEQESKRYRLADLDLDATRKVNSDHGVPFELPPAR